MAIRIFNFGKTWVLEGNVFNGILDMLYVYELKKKNLKMDAIF